MRPQRLGHTLGHRVDVWTTQEGCDGFYDGVRYTIPGDFATVVRQAKALGCHYDADRLIAALEEECRAKQRGAKPVVGFVG